MHTRPTRPALSLHARDARINYNGSALFYETSPAERIRSVGGGRAAGARTSRRRMACKCMLFTLALRSGDALCRCEEGASQ